MSDELRRLLVNKNNAKREVANVTCLKCGEDKCKAKIHFVITIIVVIIINI